MVLDVGQGKLTISPYHKIKSLANVRLQVQCFYLKFANPLMLVERTLGAGILGLLSGIYILW